MYMQSFSCSMITLVCAAMDRLVAISKPVWYKHQVTPFRIKCLLSATWVYALALSSVFVVYLGLRATSDHILAVYIPVNILPDWCYSYVIMPLVYAAIISNIALYGLTFYHIRKLDQSSLALKSKNPTQAASTDYNEFQRSKRFMRMTLASVGFLLSLWVPYSFVSNTVTVNNPDNPDWLAIYVIPFAYFLAFCNSWVNPVLYCWLNKDYRRAYMRVLGIGGGKRSATVHSSEDNGASCSGTTLTVKHF